MRYAKLIIGIVLLIKGIKATITLPAAISAVHASTGGSGFAAGFIAGRAAGEVSGLVIGTFALLLGGGFLAASGLAHRRVVDNASSAD